MSEAEISQEQPEAPIQPPKNIGGRPSLYTDTLAAEICSRISSGEKVTDICLDNHMPNPSTVYLWLAKNETFSEQYAKAMADRTWSMAEDILDISDNGANDWMERHHGEDVSWVTNGEALQRSRLRVDTRKWLMSKMQPKKYGEKVSNEHTGLDGGPIKTLNTNIDITNMNPDALDALEKALLLIETPQDTEEE